MHLMLDFPSHRGGSQALLLIGQFLEDVDPYQPALPQDRMQGHEAPLFPFLLRGRDADDRLPLEFLVEGSVDGMQEEFAQDLVMRFFVAVEKRRHPLVEFIVGVHFHAIDVDPSFDFFQRVPTCFAEHVLREEDIDEGHAVGQRLEAEEASLFDRSKVFIQLRQLRDVYPHRNNTSPFGYFALRPALPAI